MGGKRERFNEWLSLIIGGARLAQRLLPETFLFPVFALMLCTKEWQKK
jgi:hypothetical protein